MSALFEQITRQGITNQKIREILKDCEPADVAELFDELDKPSFIRVFRLLSKDGAAEVFSYLEPEYQEHLLQVLTDKEISSVVNDMFVDDAVDLIEEMPANLVIKILKNADEQTRGDINSLLQYPESSAGSIMTTEFVNLSGNMTVDEAFERIRLTGTDKETIYTCFISDERYVLKGIVSVKDMLLSEGSDKISEIMEYNYSYVFTHDDREVVAEVFNKYHILSLPVVDLEHRLVGIVTADDIISVINEEATEDIAMMNAVAPSLKSYSNEGVFTHYKRRFGWLLFLSVSGFLSGIILAGYEEMLSGTLIVLSYSIPMLMGTGGNAGSQSSTLIIRGMALGEIHLKDAARILLKEFLVATIAAVVLMPIVFLKVRFVDLGGADITNEVAIMISFTVALSLYAALLVAKLIGAMLPLLAKLIKIDAAVMAAPLITTIVDASTLLVYLGIAMKLVVPML